MRECWLREDLTKVSKKRAGSQFALRPFKLQKPIFFPLAKGVICCMWRVEVVVYVMCVSVLGIVLGTAHSRHSEALLFSEFKMFA